MDKTSFSCIGGISLVVKRLSTSVLLVDSSKIDLRERRVRKYTKNRIKIKTVTQMTGTKTKTKLSSSGSGLTCVGIVVGIISI